MGKILRDKSSSVLIALALLIFGVAVGVAAFGKDYTSSAKEQSAETYMQGESVILDLNTITKEQLMEFDYIDEVMADRIIRYREEKGGFDSIEELDEIPDIGEKRLRAIVPYVKLE